MTKRSETLEYEQSVYADTRERAGCLDRGKWIVLGVLALLHFWLLITGCLGRDMNAGTGGDDGTTTVTETADLSACTIDLRQDEVMVGDEAILRGTAGDYDVRVLRADGTSLGVAETADGNWEYPFSPSSQGRYNFTVRAVKDGTILGDCEGSATLFVNPQPVPTAVPVPARLQPNFRWLGYAAAAGVVAADQVDLIGGGTAGSDVRLELSGDSIETEVVDTVTIGDDNRWQYQPGTVGDLGLAPGNYEYTAIAVEDDGSDGESSRFPFTVSAAPTIDAHTNGEEATISGTSLPDRDLELFIDGASVGMVRSDASGNWTYTGAALAPGTHVAIVRLMDGDVAIASDSYVMTIEAPAEAVAPEPESEPAETTALTFDAADVDSQEAGDDGVNAVLMLSGMGEPGATVEVFTADGTSLGTTTVGDDGAWTLEADYSGAAGTVDLTATQTVDDAVTHEDVPNMVELEAAAEAVILTFDAADVDSQEAGDNGVNAVLMLSGTGEPGATVEVFTADGTSLGTTTVGDDGAWTLEADYSGAAGTVDLTATQTIDGAVTHEDVPNMVELEAAAEAGNGTVSVAIGTSDDAVALGALPTIELILDASWSMTFPSDSDQEIDRLTADNPDSRIGIARAALLEIIDSSLPEGAPVAVRAFGNIEGNLACRTDLMQPITPLDKEATSSLIASIAPQFNANTAIAAALQGVPADLAGVEGPVSVVLLTDGQETCGGDPAAAIQALRDQGIDVKVDIVGFAIADDALKAEFESWAEIGGGAYYDAADSDSLVDALRSVFGIGYEVVDADGEVVATGRVGLSRVVPAGTYTINILTDPAVSIEGVVIETDADVTVEVK